MPKKLREEKIGEMRRLYTTTKNTSEVSRRFGISQGTVWMYTVGWERGFKTPNEYQLYLVRKAGYRSFGDYLEVLAMKKGFDSIHEQLEGLQDKKDLKKLWKQIMMYLMCLVFGIISLNGILLKEG